MAYVKGRLTYLGIDESSMSLGRGLIVVAAETENQELIRSQYLDKAADLLTSALAEGRKPVFPSFEEMKYSGLKTFYWTRAKGGRFSRQDIQHAAITNTVTHNGYIPEKTVLMIDTYSQHPDSVEFLQDCLHRSDFKIPLSNIQCIDGGDRTIPIINYADLIAFQIGVALNQRHRRHFPEAEEFDFKPQEIPFDMQRRSLKEEERDNLEAALKR
jgi:hypothetical protein